MIPIFKLLTLAVKGLKSASTPTQQDPTSYGISFDQYTKAFFDDNYQFLCYKFPLGDMPKDIVYYQSQLGHITLMKRQSTTSFEICETNIISEKELAIRVKLSYVDFEMTGIQSKRRIKVTQNQFFVLLINDTLDRFEVLSSLQEDLNDKMIKNDFGEYLTKYLIKNQASQQNGEAAGSD